MASAGPALADCLTPEQMRAMTVTLADLASERIVKHCTALEGTPATFLSSQPAAVTTHFDPLRDAAADVLIQKYAPFLASRKAMALKTVEPIIGLMIDEFGLEDMDANACRQMDITIEAFSTLEPDQSADVLTVFLSRAAQMEGNAMMQPCDVSQAQQ